MPKENALQKDIRDAKFINALIDTGGVASKAYKATRPQVTDGSARELGSRALASVDNRNVVAILKERGCTQEAVLSGLWDRMQRAKAVPEYARGVDILCKVAGWYTPRDGIRELMESGLDLVEIVKIRLSKSPKSNDKKDISQVIDVSSTSTDALVKEDKPHIKQ